MLDHVHSLAVVRGDLPSSGEIVLVDDVVTKGRTLVGAALRLTALFPGVPIRAFALVRTMGTVAEIERVLNPCLGAIRWDGRDTSREP